MNSKPLFRITRRDAILMAAATAFCGALGRPVAAATAPLATRAIPRTGERLPVIGIGTSQVWDFDLADSSVHAERRAVLETMIAGGAKLIDTAPVYGRAEANVGALVAELKARDKFFIATKVGVGGGTPAELLAEMRQSQQRLQTQRSDLLQYHSARTAETDLGLLRDWQRAGNTRYVGVTHWQDSSHEVLAEVLKRQKPDFVQVNYSLDARDAEENVLPVARDLGIAVLINVPFGRNRLFNAVKGKMVPAFAQEFGATTWAQFFLKFILANEAVTAINPGTDKPEYMADNITAGRGAAPTAAQRKQMLNYWATFG
jgi:aryl-alcohol dehydrogenase-like predicted oxidoreductase